MRLALALAPLLLPLPVAAWADEPAAFALVLKDHKFDQPELTVPAGQKLRITVRNEDDAAAEFESAALKVEKLVTPGREITVRLDPLEPGRYPFMDEFHNQTAQGTLVVTASGSP